MRKAFSMLTAIVVIVLMAGVTALVMNLSGKIIKETSAQYRKEQSILLAKSYTEYAILAIQAQNMVANGCLRSVQGMVNSTAFDTNNTNGANRGEGYRVLVSLRYIGLPAAIACPNQRRLDRGDPSTSNDTAVQVDVNVRYRDIESVDSGGTPQNVHYNRRTLQRL